MNYQIRSKKMNTENTNQPTQVCCGASAGWRAAFWGVVLVALGSLGLLSNLVPLQHLGGTILPALLMLWGAFILINTRRG
jgi:predicted MFS family arabinose efflux permease